MKYKSTPLSRLIWCRIRFFQNLNNVGNDYLSKTLSVKPRTLNTYDRCADNITLGQIQSFLDDYSLSIEQLLSS